MNKTKKFMLAILVLLVCLFATILLLFIRGESDKAKEKVMDKAFREAEKTIENMMNEQESKNLSLTDDEFFKYIQDTEKYRQVQIYVSNSGRIFPKNVVKIYSPKNEQNQLITDRAIVTYVQWKVSSPFRLPEPPLEGFLTVLVTNETEKKLKSEGDFSVEAVLRQ